MDYPSLIYIPGMQDVPHSQLLQFIMSQRTSVGLKIKETLAAITSTFNLQISSLKNPDLMTDFLEEIQNPKDTIKFSIGVFEFLFQTLETEPDLSLPFGLPSVSVNAPEELSGFFEIELDFDDYESELVFYVCLDTKNEKFEKVYLYDTKLHYVASNFEDFLELYANFVIETYSDESIDKVEALDDFYQQFLQ